MRFPKRTLSKILQFKYWLPAVAYAGFLKEGRVKLRIMKTKNKGLWLDLARFSTQIFCLNSKGGAMTQFYALFLSIYALLAPPREGGAWHNAPPKYAPGYRYAMLSRLEGIG